MTGTSQTAVFSKISAEASTRMVPSPKGLRPHDWLLLSVWCGLVVGPIEVGTIVVRKSLVDLNQFYWISRHFVWLIPLTNLGIFLAVGVALAMMVLCWPRLGNRLAARLLCAVALLAPLWAAFPRIYGPAGAILALGLATRLVPALSTACRRVPSRRPDQLPVPRGSDAPVRRFSLVRRSSQRVARGGTALALAELLQRRFDRTGHGVRGSSQPQWI